MKDVNATIRIDLTGKREEDIWRAIKYTRRKYVQQAIKEGLVYERASSESDLKKMYEMHMKTLIEGGTASWTYERWKKFVEPAGDKFYFVKKDNIIVGCFALASITEKFYGLDSNKKGIRPVVYASIKEYQQYRTHDYMYWITIKYSLENKYDFVDLGGWQINARGHLVNVNKFKEEWGGEVYYYHWNYPLFTAVRRKLIRKFGFFWKANQFVKKKMGNINESVHDEKVREASN
jgi:lipid II:glycine glycyltransferase (peptidoglycan interpeptide bridge formation enzyme)